MIKMFKNFKSLSFGVVVFSASIIFLLSCGGGGGGLSGTTWQLEGQPVELSFEGDKFTMTLNGHPVRGTYSTSGGNITMQVDGLPEATTAFTLKGNKLSITQDDGEVNVYTRK